MTTTPAVRRSEHEHTWDAVADWLDRMFAVNHHNHRAVDNFEGEIEMMSYEIQQLDQEINPGELTPTERLASHRLTLRFRDMHDVLHRKWASPAVRASAERALRGIHERFLGPVPSAKQRHVIFSVSHVFHDTHLRSYIQSHRLEREPRWYRPPVGRSGLLTVVEGPQWVHDIYRHLVGTTLRGAALRAHYPTPRGHTWGQEGHFVSPPIEYPGPDVIETALRLWEPDDHDSPYSKFENAVEAAILL